MSRRSWGATIGEIRASFCCHTIVRNGARLRAEYEALDDTDNASAWAFGYFIAAANISMTSVFLTTTTCLCAVCTIWLDWTTAGDAPALTTLFASAIVLSFVKPSHTRVIAAILGGSIWAAHGLADVTGLYRPPYQFQSLTALDWLVISSVAAAAMLFGVLGATLRRACEYRSQKPPSAC